MAREGEVLGQCGVLYGAGKLQLLLDALLRRGDVALEHADRLVDVVGQRGELGGIAHGHHLVQVAAGDAVQRGVDQLQVVDHDGLHQLGDQHIDHREQHDARQRGLIGLGVAVGVDLLHGQQRQQLEVVAQVLRAAQRLGPEQARLEERLRGLGREGPYGVGGQGRIPVFPRHDEAVGAYDVKGARPAHVEVGQRLVEPGEVQRLGQALLVHDHADHARPAARARHGAHGGGIDGLGLRRPREHLVEQRRVGRRLAGGLQHLAVRAHAGHGHQVVDVPHALEEGGVGRLKPAGMRRCLRDGQGLHARRLPREGVGILLRLPELHVGVADVPGDRHQRVAGVLYGDLGLQTEGEQQVERQYGGGHREQPELEALGDRNLLGAHPAEGVLPLPRAHLQRDGGGRHAQPGEHDHRHGADPDHVEGHVHVVAVGDEHRVHVKDLHHRAHEEGVDGGGLLAPEDEDVHQRGHKARQAGGNAARDAGIAAHAPVGARDIALNAADQARQHAGDGVEKQARGQRPEVADVEHHVAVIHAEVGGQYRARAVDQADGQLLDQGQLPPPGAQPDQRRQQHVQRRDCRHFKYH